MSLEQLQKIRARRLEKQQTEVIALRQQVNQAQQQVFDAQHAVEHFHQWRLEQQNVLFRQLQGQPFSPHAMYDYQGQLEQLLQQEEQLKAAIPLAIQQLEQVKTVFMKAQQEASALSMKNEKTKEIVEVQHKAAQQLALYQEANQEPGS